ncbi:MAG TPA: gephyrin-like molybdotransferase Glp [Pseudorhodoplanes sp.]|nr:gephyrin-like molybdotransferase Glp [Pseudorhodoplanes sp.]
MAALLPVSEALDRVLAKASPLPSETVPLAAAHGRVLASDLKALRTQPPADVSAMDGYAVRAADIANAPVDLTVTGEVAAGRPFTGQVNAGEAVRIFTGGVVPPGADTIAIQEHAERNGDRVRIQKSAPANKHIRRAGLDFKTGDVLLARGRFLTGRDVTLAAATNNATIPVARRARVAVFATGDELIMAGSEPGPGQIVYSNGYAVAALARSEGAEVIDLGIVPDRLDDTISAIRRAREAGSDILVTTGGASVGDYDLVQKAFAAEGVSLSFWKVALRPGRPLMHGVLGGMQVLGLPGNPVSAFVCAFLFLLPLLRRLAGRSDAVPQTESAVLGSDLPANDERADYLRATLSAGTATPLPLQDSSLMQALARADCLVIRAPFDPARRAGDACRILKLPL